jgi:hypothetical protein
MSDCAHENFVSRVAVGRITAGEDGPVHSWEATLTVKCSECNKRFGFRGAPAGGSWVEPRCSPDALELRVPLMGPAELVLAGPLPAVARGPMTYEVHPSRKGSDE